MEGVFNFWGEFLKCDHSNKSYWAESSKILRLHTYRWFSLAMKFSLAIQKKSSEQYISVVPFAKQGETCLTFNKPSKKIFFVKSFFSVFIATIFLYKRFPIYIQTEIHYSNNFCLIIWNIRRIAAPLPWTRPLCQAIFFHQKLPSCNEPWKFQLMRIQSTQ